MNPKDSAEGMPETVCWTQDDVRAYALSLPEACELSHHGRPDLRVRNRIFATLLADARNVGLKTNPIALDMLMRSDPLAYRDLWQGRWVGVDLERVPAHEVRGLVVDAYCLAAPRRLAAMVRG